MRISHLFPALAVAATAALALSGCASGSAGPALEQRQITHALGTTQLPDEPQRIVTVGWASTEALLAMGVVPIGIEEQSYGAQEDGLLPWVSDRLKELGAETPVLTPASTEAPAYEDIAQLQPDLILAIDSGIDQEQYGLLSQIAPTVAYPDKPWTTPWQEVITMTGEAIGKRAEAQGVLDGIERRLREAADAHPEFQGKTAVMIADDAGVFYVYRPADARVGLLRDLGFTIAPSVDELATGEESFYYTLSPEQTAKLESDIVVSFSDSAADEKAFLEQPYAQAIPAVKRGAVAGLAGEQQVLAASPNALSIEWGLDAYLQALSEAVQAAEHDNR